MQMRNLMMLSMLAALYGGQAIAAEQAAMQGAEKSADVTPKKAGKHKKDCVKKSGKTCRSSKGATTAEATVKVAQPAQEKPPADAVKAAAPAAVAVPVAAVTALSDADGRKLAQQSGCFICHAIDRKVVGPAWKDVATKYRGDMGAEARLIAKVAKGGSGAWGTAPMPAYSPRVSDADIKSLVKFVLSLK